MLNRGLEMLQRFRRFLAIGCTALFLVGIADAQTITFIHTDHLGSPIAETDLGGQLIWSAARSAYGDIRTTTGTSEHDPIGYTGASRDSSSGLIYLHNRYYDSTLGRFLSVDPERFQVSNPISFNRFAYGNNNPYRFVDPDGRIPVDTIADIGFVIFDTGALIWDEVFNSGANRTANLAALSADAAGVLIPYATGLGLVARAANAGSKIIGKGGLKMFSRAGEYGIQSYKDLMKLKKGTGLHAHHLIEKRFASILGVKQGDMAAIALKPAEHLPFTKAWAKAIPTGQGTANATKESIEAAARQIYKDYPEILLALGL